MRVGKRSLQVILLDCCGVCGRDGESHIYKNMSISGGRDREKQVMHDAVLVVLQRDCVCVCGDVRKSHPIRYKYA